MHILSGHNRAEGAVARTSWLKMPPDVKWIAFGQGVSFWFSSCSEMIMKVAAVHF